MTDDPRASDPSTRPAMLVMLARKYPEQVLANPALPLIALSEPTLWSEIVGRARASLASQKLESMLDELPPKLLAPWCQAAVRHVLPLCPPTAASRFEAILDALGGGVDRKRAGKLSRELDAWLRAGHVADDDPAALVAAALRALMGDDAWRAPESCVEAARRAAEQRNEGRWLARAVEQEWQVAALEAISRGDPPPP